MRVYEFSKQHGIPVKEVLDALREGGFGVRSHMAALSPENIDFLNKKFQEGRTEQADSRPVVAERIEQPRREHAVSPEQNIVVPQKNTSRAEAKSPEIQKSEMRHPVSHGRQSQPRVGAYQEKLELPKTPESLILASMTVGEFANHVNKQVNEVILTLLKLGVLAHKNQVLPEKVVAGLANHYSIKIIKPTLAPTTDIVEKRAVVTHSATGKDVHDRLPVIVVVGHVDHGKTTLLDYIRKTRVAQKEKGGITQHLGAYEAQTAQGKIVFLDTPGHEAFSKMRMRGVKVADIAILVVAADDGVMPQTVEAIKHARSIDIPIVVALNKVDKADVGRIEAVKRDLARYELLAEEWGGQTVVVPISAKHGTGIDRLLEMIMLQAQLMELRADTSLRARGYLLESKLEKGRGPVATFIAQEGTLRVGDHFVCGNTFGKVSSLVDSYGNRLKEVGPSIPVQIAGFSVLPEAGDYFEVVAASEQQQRIRQIKEIGAFVASKRASDGVINIMVKTDTNSSKEALIGSIEKLSKNAEKGFNIISAGVGSINESDIMLAATTGASIWGLHVKIEPNAQLLAQKQGVKVTLHGIIYKLLEELEAVALGAREIKMIRTKIGEAVVRKTFDIKGLGVIAGSYVKDGRFSRDGNVVVYRGNRKVGEGKMKSLQRDKKVVKEVHAGFECGFLVDGFNEWEVDDRVECYLDIPENQKK